MVGRGWQSQWTEQQIHKGAGRRNALPARANDHEETACPISAVQGARKRAAPSAARGKGLAPDVTRLENLMRPAGIALAGLVRLRAVQRVSQIQKSTADAVTRLSEALDEFDIQPRPRHFLPPPPDLNADVEIKRVEASLQTNETEPRKTAPDDVGDLGLRQAHERARVRLGETAVADLAAEHARELGFASRSSASAKPIASKMLS